VTDVEETDSRLLRLLTLLALLVVLPIIGTIAGAASGYWFLASLAGVALALSLGLLLAIWLAGLIARTNRVVLVATFAPLLVLTNVALVPLIAINGFIAAVAVGLIFPIAGALMGLGALIGVVVMLSRVLSFPFVRGGVGTVQGIVLTREAQPRLWQAVDELAARIRTTAPDHIVVGLEPTFFVTQGRTTCIEPAEAAGSAEGTPDGAGAGAGAGGAVAGGVLRSNTAHWDAAFDDDDDGDDSDDGDDGDGAASRRRQKQGKKGDDDDVQEVVMAGVMIRQRPLKGRILCLSLPFCRIMSAGELRAVVAHELGHYRGRDLRFSAAFYPIYRGAIASLGRLGEEAGAGVSGWPLLPAFYLLAFLIESFAEAEARLSRTRELAADRVSVEATDEPTTASALVKIHGFHRYWRRTLAILRDRIRAAEQGLNASADFAAVAQEERESPWMRRDLDEEEPPHPIDSHPPLSQRLAALRSSIQDVAEHAFTVQPAAPGLALFEDPESLERRLTLVEKAIMVETRHALEGSQAYN
jgi:Zn-dependent protease with chaperone function